ncbi:hypothetical protein [Duganella sp. HH101]|uniref:hypothetical protein n=1 Tax=Duganella sp. HH101 TaxID=1781066 RepID=UPI000893A328|nr:hypothetical protein [Duganella sp. HH101]OFA05647.1 hypothetical protein DUGA2_12260 [Duganella sp. HH101]
MNMKNDQIQTLNYCAHAIEDLRETAAMLQRAMPQSANVLYRLIAMLQSSVKFILPNCCNLVEPDEVRQAHIDLMRLPFPCVAFEAPWDKGQEGPEYIGEFKQSVMTKRIALCWDARQFEPMPGLNSLLDAFKDGGVFVLPIYWGPEHKKWTVALGGAFVPYGSELDRVDLDTALPATKIANAAKIAAGHAHAKSMQFRSEPFPILPEFYENAIATYGSRDKADAQILVDAHDEVMVLIQACSVINCANVTTSDIDAPIVLNKKREASGKQPFFSYKVLELAEERKAHGGNGAGGHHASPRMHLRRGHLRQLERKVVWVRPAMINAESPRGVVYKDYSVVPPRSE